MSRFHDCVTDILRSKFHAAHPTLRTLAYVSTYHVYRHNGKNTHSFSINLALTYIPLPDLNLGKLILA